MVRAVKETMKIGEFAKAAGVGIETIRYYERRNLIDQPPKTEHFRRYSKQHLEQLKFIKKAQRMGFSLNEIQNLLENTSNPPIACKILMKQTELKIELIEKQIESLKTIKKQLVNVTLGCENKGSITKCSVLNLIDQIK